MLAYVKNGWMRFRHRHIAWELLVSICLAFLLWMYVHNRARNTIDRVAVPVQIQLASHQRDYFHLETAEARTVQASFSGPNARIREIRRKLLHGELKALVTLTVPEDKKAEAMFSETLRIGDDTIEVPASVKVEIANETVPVTVHRLSERLLPVKLEFTGDARVSQIKIEPASVLVRGPKTVLDRASFVPTQPFAVQIRESSPTEENPKEKVNLVTELDGRPIQTSPAMVHFRCRAVPKQKTYELVDVPIHFLHPKECVWKPRFAAEKDGKTTLKLIGPVTEQAPPVLAFIDLTRGNLARGRNLEPLRLQLPKDFELAQPTAQLVSFYLDEVERPMVNSKISSEP